MLSTLLFATLAFRVKHDVELAGIKLVRVVCVTDPSVWWQLAPEPFVVVIGQESGFPFGIPRLEGVATERTLLALILELDDNDADVLVGLIAPEDPKIRKSPAIIASPILAQPINSVLP